MNTIKTLIYGIRQIILIEVETTISIRNVYNLNIPLEEKRSRINELSLVKLEMIKEIIELIKSSIKE